MSNFLFAVNTDGGPFAGDDRPLVIARLLREAADRVEAGEPFRRITDEAGNRIGFWTTMGPAQAELFAPVKDAALAEPSTRPGVVTEWPELHLALYAPEDDADLPNPNRFTLTGVLPDNFPGHYEVEDELVRRGLVKRAHCDSESGQLFIYPDDVQQAEAIVAAIHEMGVTTPADEPAPRPVLELTPAQIQDALKRIDSLIADAELNAIVDDTARGFLFNLVQDLGLTVRVLP